MDTTRNEQVWPQAGHSLGDRGWLAGQLEASRTGGMKHPPNQHYRHRLPAEIISHAVWLYHVFSLSFRDVAPAGGAGHCRLL
jgi:hypothetical protein